MAKDYTQKPLTAMRRSDRTVTDETWIRRFLHQAPIGILATVAEGQPFINTRSFVYDETANCLYMHGAMEGRTLANISQNDRVCFSVVEMGRLIAADVAEKFSVEYAGVVIFGRASLVEEESEKNRALQLLLDKYAPHLKVGEDYRPPDEREVRRTAILCIHIEQWSGKKKEVAVDCPGAYWYPDEGILESTKKK